MNFVYPEFLFALSAILIPIIIHLFNFRRYKTIYFTNVQFLKEVQQESTARSRLKHLLILASRILAIAFLVFAFSQPYIPADQTEKKQGPKAVSIYLDNSFSMGALAAEQSLLELAKKKAHEIIRGYKETDKFQLLTNDFFGQQQRLMGKDEFLSQLEKVTLTPDVKPLSQVIQRQKQALGKADAENLFSFIISDFQKSTSDIDKIKIDSTMETYFVQISSVSKRNVFIDSCWLISPVSMNNTVNRLVIRVSNAGDEDAEDSRVSLKLNEQVKAITDIDLPANSTVIDTINFSVTQPGKYQASIEITDYPITFDDEFFFAFEVSETMPVMAINEEKTSEYLTKLFGNDKYFEFKNAYSKQLDYSELGNYQLIILNELLSLPSGLNGELKQFVKRGGSLLIFPSMKMDLSGFNSFLSDVGTNSFYGIDDKEKNISKINYEQEVFADVFMELPENMDLPKVKLSYLFTQKSGAGEETLLTFNDGKTFLGKYTVGRGKVYLCASPLDENVSYLPVHSIFIPLMYKVAWLSKKQSPLYYTIGNVEHIEIESEVENSESIFKLKGKELEFTPQQKVIGASVLIGVNEQLNKAGIYSLFLNDDEPINNLAFNYDRKESALSFFSKEDLMLFTKESDIKLIDEIGVNLTDIVQGINEGIVLWKLCLIFALIFLGVEIILLRLPALTG